jgi:hypothetical protein
MTTTTPNFGWSVPTSTDLVKDGATAIELLGDSIDTSLVDLKGGTTGQVLSKASGTDMDFSWVAIDPLLILDAKGDLITATADDTPARLPVGANGTVLTADSSQATGLTWSTGSGWTKITSSAFSAQSAVSVDNCFTSTYKNYRVLINFTSSLTNELRMRFRVAGADNTTSNYSMGWQYQNIGGGTGAVGLVNGSYLDLMDTVTGALGHFYTLDIADPQTSSYTMVNGHAAWAAYFANSGGYFNAATVFDGLTVYPGSGDITGTISIYGYGA